MFQRARIMLWMLLVALLATLTVESSTNDINSSKLASLFQAQPSAGADPSIATSSTGTSTFAESLSADPELKEWFTILKHATRLNETWLSEHHPNIAGADDNLSNATAVDAAFSTIAAASAVDKKPKPNLNGYYRFDVRIGREPIHIGTLRKGRMLKRMYATLKTCGTGSTGYCEAGRADCPAMCRLPHIVYDKGDLKYSADSFLLLKVQWTYFNTKSHPKIQDLAFRIVARIFELMTVQSDNCRYTNFPMSRPTYMCSVANKVQLAFPINGGVIQGVLNVELFWSKKTGKNTFKCEGNTEGDIDVMMWTEYRAPLSDAMSWPEKQILPFVFCANDDCFNQNLKPNEPWHENKNCDPLEWPIGCDPSLTGPKNPKLNCPPAATPPAPIRMNKALSIIFQEVKIDFLKATENSWLFFAGDYGKSPSCRNGKDAVKKVSKILGDVEQPPWPGGTYTLDLFGVECDYKNDGSNAGALWCNEEQTASAEVVSGGAPPLAKTRHIPCKAEMTRWDRSKERCEQKGMANTSHHRVVTCDW